MGYWKQKEGGLLRMDTEKQRRFIINVLFYGILLAATIFVCRYGLKVMLPFVIAFLVALLLKPLIRFLNGKCRVNKSVAAIVVVVLFYATIGVLVTLLVVGLISSAKAFIIQLPTLYSTKIEPVIVRTFDALDSFAQRLAPDSAAAYDVVSSRITQELETVIAAYSKKLLSGVTNYALSLPSFLLNALICVIATLFMAVDWTRLKEFVLLQLPEKAATLLKNVKRHLGATLWKYTKSYALILMITFAELALGFSIIGIKNAIPIAALVAMFDILPVVGSGMITLPWAIISLLTGQYLQALGLGVIYVVVIIVRNIMEPKIVGEEVGLHPVVTLSAMVIGTYLFGGIGLLGLPVALALVVRLDREGVIHVFKKKTAAPPDASEKKPPEPPAGEFRIEDGDPVV